MVPRLDVSYHDPTHHVTDPTVRRYDLQDPTRHVTAPTDSGRLEALALACLRPRRRLRRVLADNRGGELAGLALAVERATGCGEAYAGEVRADILAADWDGPAPTAELAGIASAMAGEGLDPVVIASGRTGHYHLFCRIPDVLARARWSDRLAGYAQTLRSGTSLMRPPGWPHRDGQPVSLVSHESWYDVISALEHQAVPRTVGLSLPHRLEQLVVLGDVDGRYRRVDGQTDRSSLILAICNIAALHGLALEVVFQLLLDPHHRGGAGLRERVGERGLEGRAGARRWFERTWRKANDRVPSRGAVRDRAGAIERIAWFRELADQAPFPGVCGPTDRAVLSACHSLADRAGGLVVPLSRREVADGANVAAPTAGAALKRLRQAGWLQLVRVSDRDRAAVYALDAPRSLSLATGSSGMADGSRPAGTSELLPARSGSSSSKAVPSPTNPHDLSSDESFNSQSFNSHSFNSHSSAGEPVAQEASSSIPLGGRGTGQVLREWLAHDAFHRFALGKGCFETLSALSGEGQGAGAIAARTGRHPGSVRRHLVKLEEAELAVRDGREWCALPLEALGALLDDAAEAAGTTGSGRRRHERFVMERRSYRLMLARRDARGEETPARRPHPGGEQLRWNVGGAKFDRRRAPPDPLVQVA